MKDLVFLCKKCGAHIVFVTGTAKQKVEKISTLDTHPCPSCGEEGYENWIFKRTGDWEKEYGDKEKDDD